MTDSYNSGARTVFTNSVIAGCDIIVRLNDGESDLSFVNCSLEGTGQFVKQTGSVLSFYGCHFETQWYNFNKYLFTVEGNGSTLNIYGGLHD